MKCPRCGLNGEVKSEEGAPFLIIRHLISVNPWREIECAIPNERETLRQTLMAITGKPVIIIDGSSQ